MPSTLRPLLSLLRPIARTASRHTTAARPAHSVRFQRTLNGSGWMAEVPLNAGAAPLALRAKSARSDREIPKGGPPPGIEAARARQGWGPRDPALPSVKRVAGRSPAGSRASQRSLARLYYHRSTPPRVGNGQLSTVFMRFRPSSLLLLLLVTALPAAAIAQGPPQQQQQGPVIIPKKAPTAPTPPPPPPQQQQEQKPQ